MNIFSKIVYWYLVLFSIPHVVLYFFVCVCLYFMFVSVFSSMCILL